MIHFKKRWLRKTNFCTARFLGFTLIEILIVLVIISIVTSTALLVMSGRQTRLMENLAKEIVRLFPYAEQYALVKPAVVGLVVNQTQFQFLEYQPVRQKSEDSVWKPFPHEPSLGLHTLPAGIHLKLLIMDKLSYPTPEIKKATPTLLITPSGEITPFVILIGAEGKKPHYQVIGEANGRVYYTFVSDTPS